MKIDKPARRMKGGVDWSAVGEGFTPFPRTDEPTPSKWMLLRFAIMLLARAFTGSIHKKTESGSKPSGPEKDIDVGSIPVESPVKSRASRFRLWQKHKDQNRQDDPEFQFATRQSTNYGDNYDSKIVQ
jgi:hypothetical protein